MVWQNSRPCQMYDFTQLCELDIVRPPSLYLFSKKLHDVYVCLSTQGLTVSAAFYSSHMSYLSTIFQNSSAKVGPTVLVLAKSSYALIKMGVLVVKRNIVLNYIAILEGGSSPFTIPKQCVCCEQNVGCCQFGPPSQNWNSA